MKELKSEEMKEICFNYLDENWKELNCKFLQNVNSYDISEDTKKAFKEALDCFNLGLYRSSILTIFPYVESEVRFSFNNNPKDSVASIQNFQEFIKSVPLGVFFKRSTSRVMVDSMFQILYTHAKDQEKINFLKGTSIPNRHAAIHGIIHYDKKIHALNAIIFAEYVFGMIDICKEYVKSLEEQ